MVVKIIKCRNATDSIGPLKRHFLNAKYDFFLLLLFSFDVIKTVAHSVFIRLSRHVNNVK